MLFSCVCDHSIESILMMSSNILRFFNFENLKTCYIFIQQTLGDKNTSATNFGLNVIKIFTRRTLRSNFHCISTLHMTPSKITDFNLNACIVSKQRNISRL